MATTEIVRARVDPVIKREAGAVLASLGLSVSDALRMLLTRVARDKALPFEPSQETQEAMREAQQGKLSRFDTVEALMADLHAED
jgi:DNA-damage-inducible protein J